jgi:hypothetical protein
LNARLCGSDGGAAAGRAGADDEDIGRLGSMHRLHGARDGVRKRLRRADDERGLLHDLAIVSPAISLSQRVQENVCPASKGRRVECHGARVAPIRQPKVVAKEAECIAEQAGS